MPEGLSASEVAKKLRHHHHQEVARQAISRAVPVIEVVLLSVVTIVTAWAGYSAARWSTESRRFRPQLRIAFDAWQATNPDTNPAAPPGPTFMKEYVQPELAQAADLDKRADEATADGDRAGLVADNYIRITLLLATVLFLVGIGTTFTQKRSRYVLASVGGVMLLAAVVLIAQQPLPG